MENKQSISDVVNKVLIVVDMQNDFVTGSLGTIEARECVPKVVGAVKEAFKYDNNIIYTMDTHRPDYLVNTLEGKYLPVEHCIEGTEGHDICKEVKDAFMSCDSKCTSNLYRVTKETFGYVDWKKEYDSVLHDADSIELCGLCTDICVLSNALILRALYPNKVIAVHSDACAGTTPDRHLSALQVMKSCQIDILVNGIKVG